MPWKVDEHSAFEVQDGNPIWIYEGGDKDGKEAAVDFTATLDTIQRLTGESMEQKNTLKALEDAEVEQIKQGVRDSYEQNIATMNASHTEEVQGLNRRVEEKDKQISELFLRSAFDQSAFLREKTVLLPEIAYGYLADRFEVEIVDGKIMGYARDEQGNKLVSVKKPGEIASLSEAIELLIKDHPQKDRILKMDSRGAGTLPGRPRAAGSDLLSQYKQARQGKDILRMTSIKRQMAEAGRQSHL